MHSPAFSQENTLGPYRLLRKLGEGGMGTVYLAHDDSLGRHVAIKVLRLKETNAQQQASMTRRFMREAKSTARLNHARVVTIYSVGQTEGTPPRPYLVMEYVERGSMADELHAEGPMHWRVATEAIRDAVEALAAAHAAGIIHRDIKPANLMRGRDGGIKLVDFGLARAFENEAEDADLTYPGAFVGSPSYASPEQIAGAALLDGRADLYSLAATWFTLIAGQPPFMDDDPAEVMRMHLSEEFPGLQKFAHVPAALLTVLRKASRKRAADRYASAAAMGEAVAKLLAASESDTFSAARGERSDMLPPPVMTSVTALESQLSLARISADSSTQLAALRSLYGLYTQLDRREDATKVFREALVLHVQMHTPPPASHRGMN